MGIGNSLQRLGRFLEACDGDGRVSRVELAETTDSGTDGTMTAEIELMVSPCPSDEGGVSLRGTGIELDPRGATVAPDGTVRVTLSAFVPTGDGPTNDDADSEDRNDSTATWRDRDVPPFEDPDFLAEVYESCDTFAEMAEALGMDVTAETVRRYMIDHGIHDPRSYDTTESDDTDVESTEVGDSLQTPVVLADGIGLPEDVTIDRIVETVRTSKTVYEVKDDIGIEREDALEMLRELDLLEFVVGRLATEAEREVSREVVIERLRENAEP